jgi:hypothetical protein
MTDEDTKTEDQEPKGSIEEMRRKGIMAVEIKVTYEDGWEQTMKSPPIIKFRQAGGPILTPSQERPIVKAINKDGINKAVMILDSVRKDVIDTMPSEEELKKAQQALAEQKAEMGRGGPMIAMPGQTPPGASS